MSKGRTTKAHTFMCLEPKTKGTISANVFFPSKCLSQHFRTKTTNCQILGEMVREATPWTTLCFIQCDWL